MFFCSCSAPYETLVEGTFLQVCMGAYGAKEVSPAAQKSPPGEGGTLRGHKENPAGGSPAGHALGPAPSGGHRRPALKQRPISGNSPKKKAPSAEDGASFRNAYS